MTIYIGIIGMSETLDQETERWSRELRKGAMRIAVLVLLAEAESYGYEILTSLRGRSGGRWTTTEATLYPLLHDLEAKGYLASRWKTTDTGVPPRKYYTLTPDGRKLLVSLREEWRSYRDEMDRFIGGG